MGLLDDAILIPLGVYAVAKLMPVGVWERHRAAAERAVRERKKISSRAGVVLVALTYVILLLLTVRFFRI